MVTLLMLLACANEGGGAATTVTYDNARSGSSATSVQGALDELYVRCALPAATEAPAPAIADATVDLAGRIQLLELRQAEQTANGGYGADKVSYDPRMTTLAGRTVQQALDELEARVTQLERGSIDNGAPGPALFELRDKRGNLVPADGAGGHPGGQPPPMGGQAGGQAGGPPGQPPPGASKGPTPPR